MRLHRTYSLALDVPEFFQDPEFVAWLNNGNSKLTTHAGGEPTEWADVIVLVDPGLQGEGSDSDMPAHIWDAIVTVCKREFSPNQTDMHIQVWLRNVE